MNAKQWMMLALAALGVAIVPQTGQTAPATAPEQVVSDKEQTRTARDAKMEWFREARFGLFFNFGLYSYYGGIWKGQVRMANRCSEWMMIAARAPVAEYAAAAKVFDPQGFDADEWIRTVREAGARYVVFDAKHHDGFALFRTEASPFNIVDATPFGRDLVAEIAAACRKYGVKFGIYYSQNLDWHHPGGGGGGWDPAQKGRMEDYLENVCIPQLRELLTNYGKVDILWYDIPNGVPQAYAERIDRMVRELQPEIIVNNRLRHGIPYDIQTPENFVPATGLPGVDWETCLTFNHSWGYSATDHDWKSARDVLHYLCDTASKGGNLLLNLGPDAYGIIPRLGRTPPPRPCLPHPRRLAPRRRGKDSLGDSHRRRHGPRHPLGQSRRHTARLRGDHRTRRPCQTVGNDSPGRRWFRCPSPAPGQMSRRHPLERSEHRRAHRKRRVPRLLDFAEGRRHVDLPHAAPRPICGGIALRRPRRLRRQRHRVGVWGASASIHYPPHRELDALHRRTCGRDCPPRGHAHPLVAA